MEEYRWTSKGMWIKVRELQAGSEMPSGEEDRSTEMTSKPDVTGHQKNKKHCPFYFHRRTRVVIKVNCDQLYKYTPHGRKNVKK